MKRMKQLMMGLALILGIGLVFVPATVSAVNVDPFEKACTGKSGAGTSVVCDNVKKDSISTVVTTLINVLLFVVGIISVIMIIVGGILYATSAGQESSVKNAKNTILYAIVGLAVSFFAYAIVNWVVLRFVNP